MEKSGGSKLLQMQARFQQKQMAEREMKIASLYEAQQARALTRVRHSPGTPATPAVSSSPQNLQVQPGKVRQMFEERRTKGIDKSYPLKPINNNTVSRQVNGHAKMTVTAGSKFSASEKKLVKTTISSHSLVRKQKIDNMFIEAGDLNHNHELGADDAGAESPVAVPTIVNSGSEDADCADGYRLEDETFPEALAPAHTPRDTPPPALLKRNPAKVNGVVTAKVQTTPAPRRHTTTPALAPAPAPVENTTSTGPDTKKGRAATMQRAANATPAQQKRSPATVSSASSLKAKPTGTKTATRASSSAPGDGAADGCVPCAVCARRFAPDRLDKHQSICKKAHTKKRKPFDALKHRLAGTEAEPFIMKTRRSGAGAGAGSAAAGASGKASNSNWRQKHEEFIRAIRAAKQVQAHLNAGGKLSELPPPPPSENPDYVTCPSCKRRFNRAAAERHVPKCATYQFNKPKAQPAKRR